MDQSFDASEFVEQLNQARTSRGSSGESWVQGWLLQTVAARRLREVRLFNDPVPCGEYQRLDKIYRAALIESSKISLRSANMETETWSEAAMETRKACKRALIDLKQHKAEHGC
jgi:hypothetical protein